MVLVETHDDPSHAHDHLGAIGWKRRPLLLLGIADEWTRTFSTSVLLKRPCRASPRQARKESKIYAKCMTTDRIRKQFPAFYV